MTAAESNTIANGTVGAPFDQHDKEFLGHPIYKYYEAKHQEHLDKLKTLHSAGFTNENLRPRLTGETLTGPNKISFRSNTMYIIDPIFLDSDHPASDEAYGTDMAANSSFTFFYLGDELTGHASIIHGGLQATILDEIACRLAFQNFPSKKGVTANLNINYRKPCYSDSFILLRCDILKKQGRKCWVNARIYLIDNKNSDPSNIEISENLISECECFVIEPKWVQSLQRH